MTNQFDPDLSFVTGYVVNRDLVVIISEQDRFIESKPHSIVFLYKKGSWSKFIVDWPIVSVCGVDNGQVLLSLGLDGRVHAAQATGFTSEDIDASQDGPIYTGNLLQIRIIQNDPYVVGMGRQVYRRLAPNNWERMDQSVRQSIEEEEILGFTSIDGFNYNDLYAVGYGGEIWHFNGKVWRNIPSPTNLVLNEVRCMSPDVVYVVGQCGVILRGRNDVWDIICENQVTENFWGIESFNGNLYLSTSDSVYKLVNEMLVKENIGLEGAGCASSLHANDGVLWSFGTKFLSYIEGDDWNSVSVPRV